MEKICISGCGDIGQRVARLYRQHRQSIKATEVYGFIRRPEVRARLEALDVIPVLVDLDNPETLTELPTTGAVLFHFAPPPSQGQADTRFRNLLQACVQQPGLPKKLVLLSTTAVYGDCRGAWIDEMAPVNPQTDRGKRRLDAENALREWSTEHGVPYCILRVSGIYGPGRLPLERLRQGLPILREDQAPYSNRIHQDDLAMVCVAAEEKAPNGAVYNVCDGHPSTMSHYFKSVAQAAGLPLPPELEREQAQQVLSAGMLSYLRESRRMHNEKLLRELGVTLQYPNLATGLAAMQNNKEALNR